MDRGRVLEALESYQGGLETLEPDARVGKNSFDNEWFTSSYAEVLYIHGASFRSPEETSRSEAGTAHRLLVK